jgi:hypothetical protein
MVELVVPLAVMAVRVVALVVAVRLEVLQADKVLQETTEHHRAQAAVVVRLK